MSVDLAELSSAFVVTRRLKASQNADHDRNAEQNQHQLPANQLGFLEMKAAIYERDSSIFTSALFLHLFRCFTLHWLGIRRKMGVLRDRGICIFLGDHLAYHPRHRDGRIGWHLRVQSRNARYKQGERIADIGRGRMELQQELSSSPRSQSNTYKKCLTHLCGKGIVAYLLSFRSMAD